MNLQDHPVAQMIRLMDEFEYAALKNDVTQHGLIEPIILYEGKILDGRNRYKVCCELGIAPQFVNYEGKNPVAYVYSVNIKRRHLSKYELAVEALKEKPEIAKRAKERQKLSKGRGKKGCPNSDNLIDTKNELASLANVSHDTIAKVAKIEAKADKATKQALIKGDLTINAAYAKINPHVSANTGQSEWFTPPEYLEAARKVMGGIDVDPASTPAANSFVKAKIFYTVDNSGLNKKWHGRVFLNPPYSQPEVKQFCNTFADKFTAGEVTEGCVLINNVTETAFAQRLLNLTSVVCFPASRVKFLDAQGNPGAPLQGQMVLYFGTHGEAFAREFRGFGICLWTHAVK